MTGLSLSARPKLGEAESVVSLLTRCAIRNEKRLPDLSWWTARPTLKEGVSALVAGDPEAMQQLAGLLGKPAAEIERGTLVHLDRFNAERLTAASSGTGYVSRAQQDKGPTTFRLPGRPFRGSAKPAFVHTWKLPYCPECLRRDPDRWPLHHHLAVPGVCLVDDRILLLGCGSCGGAGVTVAGQATRPAHCVDCRADLRRAKALPLQSVDGLDSAATHVTGLLRPDQAGPAHELLGAVLDLVTLGLISDPAPLRGAATSSLRHSLIAAQHDPANAARPLRLTYLPEPAHVTAYLPGALAIAQAHLDDPEALSPLATLHGLRTMTPYDCFLGPATRTRIRDDRRRLHKVLARSDAGTRFTPRLPPHRVPPLLPLHVYDHHLADLAEPALSATGWPSAIEARHALATQFRGELRWQQHSTKFVYGCSHDYRDEAVLHALHGAMVTAGLDEQWAAGQAAAAAELADTAIDWDLRRALLDDEPEVARLLEAVPASDPGEAHRWLHQVWGCVAEPGLGLYGPNIYLLNAGETSADLAAQLSAAADNSCQRLVQVRQRRRA